MSISGACDYGRTIVGENVESEIRLYESSSTASGRLWVLSSSSESLPSESVMRSESDLASAPDALVASGIVFSDHDRPR